MLKRTILPAILLLALVATGGYLLWQGMGTAPSGEPEETPPYAINTHFIEERLTEAGIPYQDKSISRFIVNDDGSSLAVILEHNEEFWVYKNGALLQTGTKQFLQTPVLFQFSGDGYHVIFAVKPTELYLDDIRVSRAANAYSYYTGSDAVSWEDDTLIFPEHDQIVSYTPRTHERRVLYRTGQSEVVYLRIHDGDIYYSTQELGNSDGAMIWRNGESVTEWDVSNPANFGITQDGEVVYFIVETTSEGARYTLMEGGDSVYDAPGYPGFVFISPEGDIWHAGFTVIDSNPKRIDVSLLRNGALVTKTPMGNIEGFMAFSPYTPKQYAVRYGTAHNPSDFHLLKNGEITGEIFQFEGTPDFLGLHFSPEGNVYMRNFDGNRWLLYEDGRERFGDTFQDVWYFSVSEESVDVYGTRRK